jgi:ferredoxin
MSVDSGQTGPLLDILRVPGIGSFLCWKHARTVLALPLLLVALMMMLHGFLGPQLAPKNLATTLTWVHYRGILVLTLLVAGNLFCMACPFMLPRNLARRFLHPRRPWPRRLRNKWLAVFLFALVLFSYELFDLWGSPFWTATLILIYFVLAFVIDALFAHAPFCKFVCPIGQFNFVSSTLSPLEITVRSRQVCSTCHTVDCIRGKRDVDHPNRVTQRGCELALFQPHKVGNMDCTFCLDCIHACPHDNVGITSRLPGSELWSDARRSGIGRFSRRTDLAALGLLFTFGALLNAFGMVSPVYAVESWLADAFGTTHEAPVLATLFIAALIVEPALLLAGAAWISRRAAGTSEPLLRVMVRFAFGLVPFGFAMWLAHYAFHFFTGLWTFVPVLQSTLAWLGAPILGDPQWGLSGFPVYAVYPLELGFLGLGFLGSLLVTYRIAAREVPDRALRAFLPWALLVTILLVSAIWLLSQPMEMRGTFLGS